MEALRPRLHARTRALGTRAGALALVLKIEPGRGAAGLERRRSRPRPEESREAAALDGQLLRLLFDLVLVLGEPWPHIRLLCCVYSKHL